MFETISSPAGISSPLVRRTAVARFAFAENFLNKRIGADFAAPCSQIFSHCERDAMHSAFDQVVAGVLQDRGKKPAELCASSIVGRGA